MSFRLESSGFVVGTDDRVSRAKLRVICEECGGVVDARSTKEARALHACPAKAVR